MARRKARPAGPGDVPRAGRLDTAPTPAPGSRRRSWLIAAAIVAATVLAYLPALGGEFVWDDDDYVSANATLRTAEGLRTIWLDPGATPQYYPLVHTSFWLEYRLWGLAPAGYHVTNLVLHLACALLVWRITLLLGVPAAWLVAAVFVLHPVHVESVAWITERKNVLSGLFSLSAMSMYLHFALGPPDDPPRHRLRLYLWAALLFLCALLSKTVAATLPAALLVLIAWTRGRARASDVWPLIPFFLVGITMGLVTIWLEKHHVGAQGIDWQLSAAERVVIAGRALWFYVGKLVWPANLAFMYPRWEVDATDWAQLLYPVAAVAAAAVLFLARTRIGNGPLAAVLLFAGTLFPALGFFDVFPMRYTFVADHYQYLASIALLALAVGAGASGLRARRVSSPVQFALAALVLASLAMATWQQSHIYATHEALWRDTIAKVPTSWMGHVSLGALLERRGALSEAEAHYRESVRHNPDFVIARINLGALLANQGRFADALPQFREAVRLDPDRIDASVSLGRALLYDGRPREAAAWFRTIVARWPHEAQARDLLDQALAAERRP